jgi:hypothetical protein
MQILIPFSHRVCISGFTTFFAFLAHFRISFTFFALSTTFWCINCKKKRAKRSENCEIAEEVQKCDANALPK